MNVNEFWEHEFGRNVVGYDFAGREIHKGDYGNDGSRYGWNIDEILPQSRGGKRTIDNCQITHISTNSERADKNTFTIDNAAIDGNVYDCALYQVKRASKLKDKDEIANYANRYNGKKYVIVILDYYDYDDDGNDDWLEEIEMD